MWCSGSIVWPVSGPVSAGMGDRGMPPWYVTKPPRLTHHPVLHRMAMGTGQKGGEALQPEIWFGLFHLWINVL